MGGAYSVGHDNDDLIDKLKEKDYIRTVAVERVFRMVDRAHYYLEENRDTAYEDIAWRNGLLHMSAPCIYSKVMEALELKRGMSFLNLGSGTGYLNTLAGYAIGPYGVNHGIELHADNVAYAQKRLEEFIQNAPRFDDLELCEPKFVVGNCLNLSVENRLYDRVYCGAACPPEQKDVLINMVKVGGILITPVGDQLLKITRQTATESTSENILPVSFASLIVPSSREIPDETIMMPDVNPLSLQSISRIVIRNAIRSTFEFNLPLPRTTRSRRKGKKAETTGASLYPGLASFNFVPTRDGIMMLRFGGLRDQSQAQHIFPHSQTQDSDAGISSDSDKSVAEDSTKDEEAEDDEGGNLLDHQLHIHAQALHRMQEESELNSVLDKGTDSDSSENDESGDLSMSLTKDVNGNSTKHIPQAPFSDSRKGYVKSPVEATSDPGTSTQQNKTHQARTNSSSSRKKKKMSAGTKSSALKISSATPSVHLARNKNEGQDEDTSEPGDVSVSLSGEKASSPDIDLQPGYSFVSCQEGAEDEREEQSSKARKVHKPPYSKALSSSLSSDDGAAVSHDIQEREKEAEKGVQSVGIEVPASVTPSHPCTIQKQVSYSTSAETSETSGFGSLGDDTTLFSESFKEGPSSLSSDVFHAGNGTWHSQSPSGNRESIVEGIENHQEVDWMDIEEVQNTEAADDLDIARNRTPSDEERPQLSRFFSEEDADHENSSENFDSDNDMNMKHVLAQFSRLVKRGQSTTSSKDSDDSIESDEGDKDSAEEDDSKKAPDFSSFLKEKVDTLPIPNSIKAFLLHYR